jgi:hypothetical protein
MTDRCPWKIRWMPGEDAQCEAGFPHAPADASPEQRKALEPPFNEHRAVLRDYAYPGSETILTWRASDRREFTGDWPGPCAKTPGCVLHAGHHGRCAL